MSWLSKLMPARIRTQGVGKRGVPEGLWEKCDNCGAALYAANLTDSLQGGLALARAAISSGAARRKLDELVLATQQG